MKCKNCGCPLARSAQGVLYDTDNSFMADTCHKSLREFGSGHQIDQPATYTFSECKDPDTGKSMWDIYDPEDRYICTVHTEYSRDRLIAHLNKL